MKLKRYRTPKITVIVPFYNNIKTLDQCLRSIRKSEFKNYELITVNDFSTDGSEIIAEKYADQVINNNPNLGRLESRKKGSAAAKGEILVNIDSDVVIRENTLNLIYEYFNRHKDVSALTGMLSLKNRYRNFASQYKTLYMNFRFKDLPVSVNFLYGSIYAVKKQLINEIHKNSNILIADDTDLGQRLVKHHHRIHLIKTLKVEHIKYYSLFSLIRNDFQIPFDWAQIFLKYHGWKQFGKGRVEYAHASQDQIISLIIAPLIFFNASLFYIHFASRLSLITLLTVWLILNNGLLRFIYRKKGIIFTVRSIIYTLFDNIVMVLGIAIGSVKFLFKEITQVI